MGKSEESDCSSSMDKHNPVTSEKPGEHIVRIAHLAGKNKEASPLLY
ncbi:MAG: hypothetical protein AB1847_17195 [bacterium]